MVIRGKFLDEGVETKVGVEGLFKDKLGINVDVKDVRESDSVVIVRVDREAKS